MGCHQDELWSAILRQHARPLEPIPTDCPPVLRPLVGIRAVLFDVYGTLFVSASGEIGVSREMARETAFLEAMSAVGIGVSPEVGPHIQRFFDTIEQLHAEGRARGIDYPEVNFADVWRRVLGDLAAEGVIQLKGLDDHLCRRLAVEYEARANPVWPMPGVRECLRGLASGGWILGLVSNAQFYTRALFPALLHGTAESWGFDPSLQFCSYEHGVAKPGTDLFHRAARALAARGVEPGAALYVGNDLLNDVMPAARVGFRTALFAGDARSFRLREGDPRVCGISPDLVLTHLRQLPECLASPPTTRPPDARGARDETATADRPGNGGRANAAEQAPREADRPGEAEAGS